MFALSSSANRTQTAAPTTAAPFVPSTASCTSTSGAFVLNRLSAQVRCSNNSLQCFKPSDFDPPSGKDNIAVPVYTKGLSLPSESIHDQASLEKSWAFVQAYLRTQPLSEQEMLGVLQSGLLQKTTGSLLKPLFAEAMMRSILPKGDLTSERLREIVEVICHLPPDCWANAFGEHLNFPQGNDSVVGFIQSQLTSSRLQRDEKIANGELLTDKQWQSLQKAVASIQKSIRPWRDGRLESTLNKLQDICNVRPSPEEAKFLLGEFLQRLSEPVKYDRLPVSVKRELETLRESIELETAPSLMTQLKEFSDPALLRTRGQSLINNTNSALNALGSLSLNVLSEGVYKGLHQAGDNIAGAVSMVSFVFSEVLKTEFGWSSKTPEQQSGKNGEFSLLSTLDEIERKSDFNEEVIISGPRWPKNFAARLLYIVNASDTFGIPSLGKSLITYAKSTNPVKEQKADSQQPVISRAQTNVTLEQPLEPPTAPTRGGPSHGPVYSERASTVVRMAEQIAELAQQVDTFLTQAITGYRPVEGAINAPDSMRLLADIKNFARNTPSSSFGNVGNPYADTVTTMTNESDGNDTWRAMGNQLGTWLQAAASYLVSMGMSTIQQHPRATATIAIAGLYAVVSEFYNRWFAGNDQTFPVDAHFAEEANPELRKHIVEDVELLLGTLPEVARSVGARIAHSAYEDPHQDPRLVPDVEVLLQQPASGNPDMSYAQLIEKAIAHSRDAYVLDVHDETTTTERSKRTRRAAEYVLDSLIDSDTPLKADRDLQTKVIEMLGSNQNGPLTIPEGTSIHEPFELFKQTLNDPKVLAWFNAKGLQLTTLRIHSDFVFGTVTHDGESTQEKFTLWDNSGWWQVADQVLVARQLLDPADGGLCYVAEDSNAIGRDVMLQFYGVTSPNSEEQAQNLAEELGAAGWPQTTAADREESLVTAKQAICEVKERARLANALEEILTGMANESELSSLNQRFEIESVSPLAQKSEEIRHHLDDLLELPAMLEVCDRQDRNCRTATFRVTENRIHILTPLGMWLDLTNTVNDQPLLKEKLNELSQLVKLTGDVLYSNSSFQVGQALRFKGFDFPKNAKEVRNIIQWLKISLPPSPPLGNYAADLLLDNPALVTLSQGDKIKIIEASKAFLSEGRSIIDQLGGRLLEGMSVEGRRDDADVLLGTILGTGPVDTWGHQLLTKTDWYGASEGQAPSQQHYQQLLLTAIKLDVDPVASGKSGTIAGYEIYQPSNLGRDMGAVREDIEQYLISSKGVSALSAPLVAHIFLADVAPEFLVYHEGENILMGSPNWMNLRLGTAIAEVKSPGSSRAMTAGQLNELAVLEPATAETRLLFQILGVDMLVEWAVMNGVMRHSRGVAYSVEDYTNAANRYAQQRAELTRAFKSCTQPLRTRKELAMIELRKAFPLLSESEIEAKKLWSTRISADWNLKALNGRDHGLIEIYMAGDLKEGDWWDPGKGMKNPELNRAIQKLPDLAPILTASVDSYFEEFKEAFIAPTKLLISTLPMEDRQRLELGKVELFTLREETGGLKEDETPEMQAARRGKQGTLLRCEYQTTVSYFELFPGQMKIIKRTDLPDALPLNGVMKTEKAKISKGPSVNVVVQRGTDLPFDFLAYATGSEPRANVKSPKLIIEKLGGDFSETPLQTSDDQTSYVANSYFSDKISRIVHTVIVDNFLLGQNKLLFKHAKGATSREEKQASLDKIGNYLLQLIPFVGCVQDLSSGTRMGLINGVFGCFGDVVSSLSGLVGGAGKVVGLMKSSVPVRLKAFDALQTTVSTVVSVINPLSGFADLLVGGVRGIRRFSNFLASSVFQVTENGLARLMTGMDQLRCFMGAPVNGAIGKRLSHRMNSEKLIRGVSQNSTVMAIESNGKWYRLDMKGHPAGPALHDFKPLITTRMTSEI